MDITFEQIIGKHILIGITYINKKREIIEQVQFDGTIIEASENRGIIIEKTKSKEKFELPPDLSLIKIAEPGEYKLRSTGELVINPDYISTIRILKRRG